MKKFQLVFFLLFSLNILLSGAEGGGLEFKKISVPEGLSNPTVISISKDHKGYMWFGTYEGLNKFDGYEFKVFKHDPNDSTSISYSGINDIIEDTKNRVWIGTGHGLDLYDRHTGKFEKVNLMPDSSEWSNVPIRTILEDSRGNIWATTVGMGLYKYNPETEEVKHYSRERDNEASLWHNLVVTAYEIPEKPGTIWAGTFNGLCSIDIDSEKIKRYSLSIKEDINNPESDLMTGIYTAPGNPETMWITSASGLIKFNTGTGSYKKIKQGNYKGSLEDNSLNCIAGSEDSDILWIGTSHAGLARFHIPTESFEHFPSGGKAEGALSSNLVVSIYEDPSGLLWAGTFDGGLNIADLNKENIEHTKSDPENKNSISGNLISAFYESEKYLWVGTVNTGLNRINKKNKRIKKIKLGEVSDKIFSSNAIGRIIPAPDSDDELFVVCLGGFYRINTETMEMKKLSDEKSGLLMDITFTDSTKTNLWVTSLRKGLFRYELSTGKFQDANSFLPEEIKIDEGMLSAMLMDSRSNLWLGTMTRGIYRLSPDKSLKHFSTENEDNCSILANSVNYIHEDRTGKIWIGSDGGLNIFDYKDDKVIDYTKIVKLPDYSITSIVEDDSGFIWVATRNGLIKIDPEKNRGKIFDERSGIESKYFLSGYKSDYGKMYLGTMNGYYSFDPENMKMDDKARPVILTSFRVLTASADDKDIPGAEELEDKGMIRLLHYQNSFEFEYSSLGYLYPWRSQYSYKLEGFEDEWTNAGNRRYAAYTNLSPGEYIFRLKSTDPGSVSNDHEKRIKIIIAHPWWNTPFAWITYAMIVSGILLLVNVMQRKRITEKEREKAHLREIEIRAEAAELQARIIYEENERQTRELEEARRLQLSMLPEKAPEIPGYQIAFAMQTAAEVGGDYYDYIYENDELIAALGDATGHGLRAGTMVSVIKGLFSALAAKSDLLEFFNDTTRTLRSMKLWNLYMAFTMLKIKDGIMEISAAGMPPALIYRKNENKTEEIVIKGMPLGAFHDFKYTLHRQKLEKGDIILLNSDGISEQFNERNEQFGFERLKEVFSENVDKNPEKIISNILEAGEKWRGDRSRSDDISLFAIKIIDGD